MNGKLYSSSFFDKRRAAERWLMPLAVRTDRVTHYRGIWLSQLKGNADVAPTDRRFYGPKILDIFLRSKRARQDLTKCSGSSIVLSHSRVCDLMNNLTASVDCSAVIETMPHPLCPIHDPFFITRLSLFYCSNSFNCSSLKMSQYVQWLPDSQFAAFRSTDPDFIAGRPPNRCGRSVGNFPNHRRNDAFILRPNNHPFSRTFYQAGATLTLDNFSDNFNFSLSVHYSLLFPRNSNRRSDPTAAGFRTLERFPRQPPVLAQPRTNYRQVRLG